VTGPIRVVLADDQRVVREGLGTLLGLIGGIEVVGTAADGNEALALALKLRPDVVLMDLRMPRCDGIEATRRLREHDAGIKVLVLTTYADDRSVIDAPKFPDGLTAREAEVLCLIAQGLSNAEIADRLMVSQTTVKSHVNHVFAKIGVRARAQAVTYAYRHGLT